MRTIEQTRKAAPVRDGLPSNGPCFGHWLRAEGSLGNLRAAIRTGRASRHCRCIGCCWVWGGLAWADDADSARLFAISRTSTRRFLARPEALVFCATGLSLPKSDQENLVRGNAVLLRQVLNDGIGAALAELIVVVGRTGRIGVALDLHDVVLLALKLLRKVVQRLLVLASELRLCRSRTERWCR